MLISALHAACVWVVCSAAILAPLSAFATDNSTSPVSIGLGLQMSDYKCTTSCIDTFDPAGGLATNGNGSMIDTFRVYFDARLTDQLKLSFGTELVDSAMPTANVFTAAGRFEFSDKLNIWVGRFTPPSDRANLYGPFYAADWAPYADGVADTYPSVSDGSDDGMAYWGQFGILKLQVGIFDGKSLNSAVRNKTPLTAARLTADFWEIEPGYYLNGTTYGEQDLLALGLAAQNEDSKTAYSVDSLFEKKLAYFGVVTVEMEYQSDRGLATTVSSHGWYALESYLLPQTIGVGKVQLLAKYSQKVTGGIAPQELKTREVNLNYIIRSFDARIGLYYLRQGQGAASNLEFPQVPSPQSAANSEYGVKIQLRL
jgi:hypothetical protein